jgi:hypothetical protein
LTTLLSPAPRRQRRRRRRRLIPPSAGRYQAASPPPVERTATLTAPIGTDGPDGRLWLTVGPESFGDWLAELATDIPGRAFRVTRFGHAGTDEDGDDHVLVGADACDSSCTCRGFTDRSRCKHLDALTALTGAGQL